MFIGIITFILSGCGSKLRENVYQIETEDYVNEGYEQSLKGIGKFIEELDKQLNLDIDSNSIDIKITETDKPEQDCTNLKVSFVMAGEIVEFVVETGPWKHMATPNDAVISGIARARRKLACETNFFEVYIKSTGHFESYPAVYFGSKSDMRVFQKEEKAIYSELGSNEWHKVPTTLAKATVNKQEQQVLNQIWDDYNNTSGIFDQPIQNDVYIKIDSGGDFKDKPKELQSLIERVVNENFNTQDLLVYFDDREFTLDYYEDDLSRAWFNLKWKLVRSDTSQLFAVESLKSNPDLLTIIHDASKLEDIRLVVMSQDSGASIWLGSGVLVVKTVNKHLHEQLFGKYNPKPKKRIIRVSSGEKKTIRDN